MTELEHEVTEPADATGYPLGPRVIGSDRYRRTFGESRFTSGLLGDVARDVGRLSNPGELIGSADGLAQLGVRHSIGIVERIEARKAEELVDPVRSRQLCGDEA